LPGERTDIVIEATSGANGGEPIVRLIIEVKGCWNKEVKSAMSDQLADRYLAAAPNTCGLYLVGWFLCDDWDCADSRRSATPNLTVDEAREFFGTQSRTLSDGTREIHNFVLDVTLP